MQFVKANLKEAKAALAAGRFEETQYYAEAVLESDASNYMALLLLGKANSNLSLSEKAIQAYKRATELKPLEPPAWKGILEVYDQEKNYSLYLDTAVSLIQAYHEADNTAEAAATFRKAIKFVVNKGDSAARKKLLELQLPGSPIYDILESSMAKLDLTLTRLIKMIETEESQQINKAVGKNKFKISATKEAEDAKIKHGIRSNSRLPELYRMLINTTYDDDLRRETELKLLSYLYELLIVSDKDKKSILSQVKEMASGLVVVKAPSPLAWKLEIEWADPAELKDLDYDTMIHFINNFSNQPLARVLTGFLHSEISPFPVPKSKQPESNDKSNKKSNEKSNEKDSKRKSSDDDDDDDEDDEVQEDWTPATVLEAISDGYIADPDCILSYRILGALYLRTQEYESAADVAQKGLAAIKRMSALTGVSFHNAKDNLSVILGTSYIYYQAPKNFDIAVKIFDTVLKKNPQNVPSITGKGLIYIQQGRLQEAESLLDTVYQKFPSNFLALFELAWCRVLQGKHDQGRQQLAECLESVTGSDPQSLDYRAQIWWRIGASFWFERDNGDEETLTNAFNSFARSLQENSTFAPAYTSLGLYYADIIGDRTRATKCFYKAFELDAGEIESAYRLATEFANNAEWDLVEVIATRVLDSERLHTALGSREASWPHRALGIVKLNHRDYPSAIHNFQNALRLSPKDPNSWMGLGEAYSNSGRFIASAKAFERCLVLDPENWLAQFQAGIVHRQLYNYDEAIAAFKGVLSKRPGEVGIQTALIQGYLSFAQHQLTQSLFSLAVQNAVKCIESATEAVKVQGHSTQDIWRAVGGACDVFLSVQSLLSHTPLEMLDDLLAEGCIKHSDVEAPELDDDASIVETIVTYAIVALRLSLASARSDKASQALGHYNLGLAQLKAYKGTSKDSQLHESVECFKKAIQMEPRNYEFWNAYGIASSFLNPRVAQHCFIRSLSLNMKQPVTWANLASMYLSRGDLELATETYEKTRAIDPENVASWVGQGIIEFTKGNQSEAERLIDHSFIISQGTDQLAKLLHGLSVFERASSGASLSKGATANLDNGILALQKLLLLNPTSDVGLALQSMLLERTGLYEPAVEHMVQYCESNQKDPIRYAKGKIQLARLCLGAEQFTMAIENAEEAIGLITESGQEDLAKSLLSGLLTAGLGYYFNGQFGESIEYFKQALAESEEDQDVVVLLAQVLWADGGKDEKEVALDQLFSSVGAKGASVKIALLLGVIGLVDDPNIADAAAEELSNLSLDSLQQDRDHQVQEVLSLLTKSMDPWKRAAYYWPSNYGIWKNVNPKTALQLATKGLGGVSSSELSEAYSTEQTLECSQRAVFLAPWNIKAWQGLDTTVKSIS